MQDSPPWEDADSEEASLAIPEDVENFPQPEYEEDNYGEDEYDPWVKLLQGQSNEVMDSESAVRPGQYLITNDPDESYTSLNVIPLGYRMLREYRDFDEGVTYCKSVDGKRGVGIPGGPCAPCKLKEFGPNRTAPPCSQIHSFVVYLSLIHI